MRDERATPAILLVEDNPDDEELTVLALREAGSGCAIEVVRDGVEAVACVDRWSEAAAAAEARLPGVVLLDLKLPRLDGFDVLRHIRARPQWATVPVVVMSSSSQREDILRSYQGGANSYVRKPVAFDDFRRAVGAIGQYWLMTNEHFADRHG